MECELDNITVNYEIVGHGRPLVLLHGFWTDHRQMAGCMEPIFAHRDGWQRIYLDLPGMGQTPAAPWISSSDDMLSVVCQFIEAVLPEQRFVIGGYSYGAYLARGVLSHHFSQIDGLFLVCSVVVASSAARTVPPHEILVRDEALKSVLSSDQFAQLDE